MVRTVPSAERVPEGQPNVRGVAVGVSVHTPSPAGDTDSATPVDPHDSSRWTIRAASSRTSHSQTRRTRQPSSSANTVDRSSRSRLRRILSAHSSAFGPVHGVFRPCSGQPCQKHPSTNTATRRPGRTKSGVQPLAKRRCRRNRPPAAWTALLRSSSGVVLSFRRPARWAPAFVDTQPSAMHQRYETRANFRPGGPRRALFAVSSWGHTWPRSTL